MIKINLLPVKAAKKKEAVMTQVYVGILIIIFVLAALGYRWYYQQSRINTVISQIGETNKKIEKLREAQKKFEELKKKKEILEKQINAITQLDRGRDWFIRVLDKISESVPHNQLWISQIKLGGGKKRRGRKGGGASGSNISLKGQAYDKDSVAHFMGNLSIIPCDDDLSDLEKAPVCQLRNERCRRWNEEENNWEWDFEGCRRFYKDVCDEMKSCKEDVKICNLDKAQICKEGPNSKDCKEAKEKCAQTEARCKQAKEDCTKLHESEYVRYDSIRLISLTQKKGKDKGGLPLFNYEIECRATNAP